MNDVTPLNGTPSAALPRHSAATAYRQLDATPVRTADKVELSRAAQFLSRLIGDTPVRQDLIDRVKSEIAGGTYETPEKIDAAIDELLTDL